MLDQQFEVTSGVSTLSPAVVLTGDGEHGPS